ncbi:MAG: glycosyltransferase family 4 protein [Planctomycetota bacterium]|jgi:glycosyltransferase involved in cell wall biosynthesis
MRVLMLERPHSAATFGGEQVHLRRLAQELSALGITVDVSTEAAAARSGRYDVVHLWNIQHPREADTFVRQLVGCDLPLVLTPIHADLRRGIFAHRVQEHLAQFAGDKPELERKLGLLGKRQLAVLGATRHDELPADPEFHAARQRVLQAVDAVFPLTTAEAGAIAEEIGPLPAVVKIAPVAVHQGDADPDLFRDHLGLAQPFVLLPAARIEPNKNQWLTLHALRHLALPVIVTGTCAQPAYDQLCRDAAPQDTRFVGMLSPTLLMSAMAAAEVVVHTSVIECSSLSALEGAAWNGNLVVGDTGTEHETFLDLARIVDPLDVRSIEREVQKALCGGPLADSRRQALRTRAGSMSWAVSAQALAAGYEEVLRKRGARPPAPQVHFRGVVLGPSGLATEGRDWLRALEAADLRPSLHGALLGEHDLELTETEQRLIDRCAAREPKSPRVTFHHSLIPHFEPDPMAEVNILHTVFETEGLPSGWAEVVNRADKVLVMTDWSRQAFARAGVQQEKLHVLPPPVDASGYQPGRTPADGTRPFRWLTVMDWQLRKGHDVLLAAFARAFRRGEAELWIKITPHQELSRDWIQAHCEDAVRRLADQEAPAVRVIDELLPTRGLHDLYRQADGFVLASRGEGWGRPVHEAMLMALPVVVSHGSALRTLVPDETVGYPVCCTLVPVSEEAASEVPAFRGQQWHEPDVDHLAVRLREVTWNPVESQARARRGREHITRLCDPQRVREQLRKLLDQLSRRSPVPY